MVAASMWLVGSSSSSRSTGRISAAASATRFFCPPESVRTSASKSVMPSCMSSERASYSSGAPTSRGALSSTCMTGVRGSL